MENEKDILNDVDKYINGYRNGLTNDIKNYIDDKIAEYWIRSSKNTMFGTEHFIGEYYFDGKPIYSKTVKIPLPNGIGHFTAKHNISNVDKMWFVTSKSYINSSTALDTCKPLNYHPSDGYQVTVVACSRDTIYMYTARNRYAENWIAYVTVNYTKVIDEATIMEDNIETLTATITT